MPLDLPEELARSVGQLGANDSLTMASTPDGRLLVGAGSVLRILDRSMRVLQTVPGECNGWVDAADDNAIFFSFTASLRRCTYDLTFVAQYELLQGYYSAGYVVLAPGDLLFCVMYPVNVEVMYPVNVEIRDYEQRDEIIALDAQTMQLRYRFGLGLLSDAKHMCVIADELFVCDNGNNRVQVFSLTGEHRRSISGEWMHPQHLCFVSGRLYLHVDPHLDDQEATFSISVARRILVLSLQGDILQEFTHPSENAVEFLSICYFDHKLLVSFYEEDYDADGDPKYSYGMLALQDRYRERL